MTWKEKIKAKWDEDPLTCIVIGSIAVGAAAKLIDSLSAAQSRRAYSRQVDYRTGR